MPRRLDVMAMSEEFKTKAMVVTRFFEIWDVG
jgi:hypothetical protein